MSLIPHGFFPRSQMDMDMWRRPFGELSTLEAFDPFDELDNTIGRNMQWLSRPEFAVPSMPKVPQKYRITLDCTGYAPKSIKTEFGKDNKLTVSAREEQKDESGDYHIKEFKKTYTLPAHAEPEKLVSFVTGDGELCIEVPLKETAQHADADLFPKIVDVNGGKQVQMQFAVPENIKPEHIHVNIKDRCLVVKAEEKKVKPDGVSKFHYYKKTTLPENTDFNGLKCNYDQATHKISVQAPIHLDWAPKKVAIEHKANQPKNYLQHGQQQQQIGGISKMTH